MISVEYDYNILPMTWLVFLTGPDCTKCPGKGENHISEKISANLTLLPRVAVLVPLIIIKSRKTKKTSNLYSYQ